MNPRPRWSVVVALMIGVVMASWWFFRLPAPATDASVNALPAKAVAPSTSKASHVDGIPSADDEGASAAPSAPSAGALAKPKPLPSADTQVTEIFDELAARAAAGEVGAACRLAQDLLLCEEYFRVHEDAQLSLENYAAQARPGSREEASAIAGLQHLQYMRKRGARICVGVSHAHLRGTAAMLLRAAELGSDEAAVRYALQPPLPLQDFMLDLDGWVTYRERVAGVLKQAAERGNVRANYAAYRSAAGRGPRIAGGQLVSSDPRRVVELGLAVRPHVDDAARQEIDEDIARWRREMPADVFAQAERAAERRADALRIMPGATPVARHDEPSLIFERTDCENP